MPLVLDLPKLCFCLQLVTDVNMDVSVEAIQAIGNLAQGLRTHISGSWRILLPILLVSAIQLVPSFLFLKLGLRLFLLNQLYLDFIALLLIFVYRQVIWLWNFNSLLSGWQYKQRCKIYIISVLIQVNCGHVRKWTGQYNGLKCFQILQITPCIDSFS